MGYGVSVSRTADVGVARQALAVRREVAALGLLKPDHIRSVTLYGGNVEIRPVAPGVLLARVVERPPDVETHHPEHGTAQTPIHLLSIACPRFYPHDLSRRLHLQQLRLHTNFTRDTLRLQREKNRRAIPDYSQRSTRIRTKRFTGHDIPGRYFRCAYPTTPRGSTCTRGSARGRSSTPTSATASSLTRSPTASTTPGTTTTCLWSTGSSSTTSPCGTWQPSGRSRSRAPTPSSSPTC